MKLSEGLEDIIMHKLMKTNIKISPHLRVKMNSEIQR